MAVVIFKKKPTKERINRISKEFGDYIKVVVDVEKEIITAGGRLHADGEELLLKEGSRQENLWGGGIDLNSQRIDCTAVINIRPNQGNDSMEILDPSLRKKFFKIIKSYFEGYGK